MFMNTIWLVYLFTFSFQFSLFQLGFIAEINKLASPSPNSQH